MHIKQLILEGFKTYKERTEVPPFHPLHNAILGKNGSGKISHTRTLHSHTLHPPLHPSLGSPGRAVCDVW